MIVTRSSCLAPPRSGVHPFGRTLTNSHQRGDTRRWRNIPGGERGPGCDSDDGRVRLRELVWLLGWSTADAEKRELTERTGLSYECGGIQPAFIFLFPPPGHHASDD